jgi:hypothetical protein
MIYGCEIKLKLKTEEFCMQMFHPIQDDERFLDPVIFNDESTFHVSCKVHTHNCRIWCSENLHVFLEHIPDSPKVNCFAPSANKEYGPFSMETTITGIVYLDMLQQFLIPQLDKDDQEGRIHFQQNGTPRQYLGEVHEYLSTRFPAGGLVERRR